MCTHPHSLLLMKFFLLSDTFDYSRLNTPMFLRPGDSEWQITATIANDERLEGTEYFFVSFDVVVSAVEFTVATSRVQVNITDTDGEFAILNEGHLETTQPFCPSYGKISSLK